MKKILGLSGLLIVLFSITAFADINKELIKAAKKGKAEDVYQLLKNGADVNVKDRKSMTPLHYASLKGHIEVVRILLENGADINARDKKGRIPQELALAKKRIEVLALLKKQRVKYDWERAKEQNTILGYNDYKSKYPDGTFSADAKSRVDELSATRDLKVLSESMDASDITEIRKLINAGADVNVKNKYEITSLWVASEEGYVEVVKLLLGAKADVNEAHTNGATSLWIASQEGYDEVVKLLLGAKADMNKANTDGVTPLWQASWKGHAKVVKLLLKTNADINKTKHNGITPLYIASQ
ncbi:MAG: hypothetical protein GY797_18515 [Deltaproteobacteria bacterium]|nr:hypothetical protein [Deltaproteobacteria bacterium]